MVLGHCGVLSLEEARGLAREKLVEVIKGEDPSAARKTLLRSRTVADLCHWYLAEAESGRLLGRKRRPTGILVVKFLLLSGFRRNEVLQLQTSWLGKNFSHVAFPDTKTGRQVRIIGKAAADLIRTRCRGRDITYVF